MRRRSRGSCLRCGRLLCGNLCGRGIICFTGFSDDHQYRACRDRITFTYLYRQHGPRRKALHRQNGLIGLRFAQHITALDGITNLDIDGYNAGLIRRLTGTGHFDLSHSISPYPSYIFASLRAASVIRSTEGITKLSSFGEKGVGVSGAATRTTGASRDMIACSAT